jgi:chromosome segregation ATPase
MEQIGLSRDRHIPDGNHFDEEALIAKIVDLKNKQLSLQIEQSSLEKETAEFEQSSSDLKQKYNIMGAAAEIHGWDVPDSSSAEESVEDKKWSEMNRKLEVQVLNEDIRKCLHKYEAEALKLEADIFAIEKAAKLSVEKQKELPPLLNKTATELEKEMGMTIESRIRLKARMQHDIEVMKREKAQKVHRVSALREQLALTADEHDVLQTATQELERQHAAEVARVDCLKDTLADVKQQFDTYHGPNGWSVEAWRAAHLAVGRSPDDEKTRMPVDEISAALQQWSSWDDFANPANIKKHLVEANNIGNLDLRRFMHLCSKLEVERINSGG